MLQPLSTDDLLTGTQRELMLLAGKDGVGKTSALISLAKFVEMMDPERKVFVLDTENKYPATLRSFAPDAPRNLVYYKCETMNDVTSALAAVLRAHSPGDWLQAESMSRIWERSQDLGYQAITGTAKAEYMERRRQTPEGQKAPPVTPKPDDLWSIVKGAHDSAFLDILCNTDTLNVALTTTISKPKDIPGRRENPDRKDLRTEFGIDIGLDGAPRLPYYMLTLAVLSLKNGVVSCRMLRDNNSVHENAQVEFDIESRKTFAQDFWQNCRIPG